MAPAQVVDHLEQRRVAVSGGQRFGLLIGAVPEVEPRYPGDAVGGLAPDRGEHALLVSHELHILHGGADG